MVASDAAPKAAVPDSLPPAGRIPPSPDQLRSVTVQKCRLQNGRWTLCQLPCFHASVLIAASQSVLTPFEYITYCEHRKHAS